MLSKIKRYLPKGMKRSVRRLGQNLLDSWQYARMKSPAPTENATRVVFVCKGNICRSAFAEHYLRGQRLTNLDVDSCGLDVNQGGESPRVVVDVAARFGVDLATHRPKSIAECSLERADLVLAMEFWQYRRLLELLPDQKQRIFLLRGFAPGITGLFCNIFDPYGLPDKEVLRCFRLMQKALDHFGGEGEFDA